jgi:hypothetical protein
LALDCGAGLADVCAPAHSELAERTKPAKRLMVFLNIIVLQECHCEIRPGVRRKRIDQILLRIVRARNSFGPASETYFPTSSKRALIRNAPIHIYRIADEPGLAIGAGDLCAKPMTTIQQLLILNIFICPARAARAMRAGRGGRFWRDR